MQNGFFSGQNLKVICNKHYILINLIGNDIVNIYYYAYLLVFSAQEQRYKIDHGLANLFETKS